MPPRATGRRGAAGAPPAAGRRAAAGLRGRRGAAEGGQVDRAGTRERLLAHGDIFSDARARCAHGPRLAPRARSWEDAALTGGGFELTEPTYDFAGRHVLVTGGTRGLGRTLAAAFHRAGARVTVTGTQSLTSAYDASISRYAYERLELTDHDSIVRVAQAVGPLDVLVNAAGARIPTSLDVHDREFVSQAIRLGLVGPSHLAVGPLEAPNNDVWCWPCSVRSGGDRPRGAVAPVIAAAQRADKPMAALVAHEAPEALRSLSKPASRCSVRPKPPPTASARSSTGPADRAGDLLWEDEAPRFALNRSLHAGQAMQISACSASPIPTMLWIRREGRCPRRCHSAALCGKVLSPRHPAPARDRRRGARSNT